MATRATIVENIRYYTVEAQKAAARGLTTTAAAYDRLIESNIKKLEEIDAAVKCSNNCGELARTDHAYGSTACDQWPLCQDTSTTARHLAAVR